MPEIDHVTLARQASEIYRQAIALARAGNHQSALQEWEKCLSIVEALAAESPLDMTRQKNLASVLQAMAVSLSAVGKGEASMHLLTYAVDVVKRAEEARRAATRFSFANRHIALPQAGQKLDSRQLLRNIERVVREKTGLAQISIDFGDVDLPETTFSFDPERGYRLVLSQREIYTGALPQTEGRMVQGIRAHSAHHGVRSAPPPIPRTETSVAPDLAIDTHANRYDALAHDGGYMLAFYREKMSGKVVLMRHVPPMGFVQYRFAHAGDYEGLRKDAAAHCSAFLDLAYLGDGDMPEETFRSFLREHGLYGWGAQAAPGPAARRGAPVGEGKPSVMQVGGREIRQGDSLSPQEAEEFIRRLIEKSDGPVTVQEIDESTGTTIESTVENWSEFTDGPRLNEDHFESFRSGLIQKGYLAFERDHDGLKYHTAFRVLKPRYFTDFNRFVRCQDIPGSYFGSVIPGKSWFASHRWATPANPDPDRTQFEIVREFVRRDQADGIWYDYSCMPQEPHSHADQQLFANSLRHMNSLIVTTNFLSIESDDYYSRAWCHYERMICELLCCCKRARVAPRDAPELSDDVVNKFVVEGKVPPLRAEKVSDLPLIEELLVTGADMFKMLAVSTTFDLLNSFGFEFGAGTAARLSRFIDFGKFWMIWQILAGSSEGSGIKLPNLLNEQRLKTALTQRHERFGTHVRFFGDLSNRMSQPLDMRIVEQANASRLAALVKEVLSSGPVPSAYSKLAAIQLVYWIAGRGPASH